jgi:hypothetical protein
MKTKVRLRALSVAQPWAECIVAYGKNVENRGWDTSKRGYVAIHSSRSREVGRFKAAEEDYGLRFDPEVLDYGAVVGFGENSKMVCRSFRFCIARSNSAEKADWSKRGAEFLAHSNGGAK